MTYKLKPCSKCGGSGNLCGEGMAKSWFDNGEEHLCFTDFDGYTVSCEDCEETTERYMDPKEAVAEWNGESVA